MDANSIGAPAHWLSSSSSSSFGSIAYKREAGNWCGSGIAAHCLTQACVLVSGTGTDTDMDTGMRMGVRPSQAHSVSLRNALQAQSP